MPWRDRAATVIATLLVTLAPGCHHNSYSEDAGGGDTDGPCVCTLSGAAGSIACGSFACTDGASYLCSEGALIPEGVCGDASTGDDQSEAGLEGGHDCVPECNGDTCGQTNGCGGECTCMAGLTCNAGICGNGCLLFAGSPCLPVGTVGGNSSTCCQEGNQCRTGDSGVSVCCAQTSTASVPGGLCQADTDCCGYPVAQCDPSTGTCT